MGSQKSQLTGKWIIMVGMCDGSMVSGRRGQSPRDASQARHSITARAATRTHVANTLLESTVRVSLGNIQSLISTGLASNVCCLVNWDFKPAITLIHPFPNIMYSWRRPAIMSDYTNARILSTGSTLFHHSPNPASPWLSQGFVTLKQSVQWSASPYGKLLASLALLLVRFILSWFPKLSTNVNTWGRLSCV